MSVFHYSDVYNALGKTALTFARYIPRVDHTGAGVIQRQRIGPRVARERHCAFPGRYYFAPLGEITVSLAREEQSEDARTGHVDMQSFE